MYDIINVMIHVLAIFFIIYGLIPGKKGIKKDVEIKMFFCLLGFSFLSLWGILVGEYHNLKNLFTLIW